MAPPVTIPANPEGAKGVQFAGFTSMPPTTRKVRIAPILISTMTLLASADSFTPRTSNKVRIKTIRKPGTLKYAPVQCPDAHTGLAHRRQIDAESCQLRFGISAETDGHGNIADHIFQNQVPADDPGENFAQRCVGVGVGAAGDRESWKPVRHSTSPAKLQATATSKNEIAMEGPAGGRPCISAPAVLPVRRKLHDKVQHLRVQDRRSLEVLSRRGGAGEHEISPNR